MTKVKVVAIDRENKQWKASIGGSFKFWSDQDLLDGTFFGYYAALGCTALLVERCHLHVRFKRSVSQVYTAEDLTLLAKTAREHDFRILSFPQKQTPRARGETGLEKPDDCWAIEQFYYDHPEIPMQPWDGPPTEAEKKIHDRRNDMRSDNSFRLNVMRPDYDDVQVEHARTLLHRSYPRISSETREWFQLKLVYAGKPREKLNFSETRVMSIYVTAYDNQGDLRLNDRGTFIGVRECLALLWMHPFHGRGGTARSNLVLHMLSKTETRVAGKNTRSPELRRGFSKAVKEMIQVFRDAAPYPGHQIS